MEAIRFTIITPVLNSISTISKTIESVLSQGYENIEYIIVDGGSSDGTVEFVEKFDGLISIIPGPDKNIADAMNKGIKCATGDVIGILNADDIYMPNALEKVAKLYSQSPEHIIYGDMLVSWGATELAYIARAPEDLDFECGMVINHPAMFVSKKVYEDFGAYDDRFGIAMDWELCLRLQNEGLDFLRIDEVLVHYLIGGLSTTQARVVLREMHEIRGNYSLYKLVDLKFLKSSLLNALLFNKLILISHAKRTLRENGVGVIRKVLRVFFPSK